MSEAYRVEWHPQSGYAENLRQKLSVQLTSTIVLARAGRRQLTIIKAASSIDRYSCHTSTLYMTTSSHVEKLFSAKSKRSWMGLSILCSTCRVVSLCASGGHSSIPFDYRNCPTHFIRVLIGVPSLCASQIGMPITLSPPRDTPRKLSNTRGEAVLNVAVQAALHASGSREGASSLACSWSCTVPKAGNRAL